MGSKTGASIGSGSLGKKKTDPWRSSGPRASSDFNEKTEIKQKTEKYRHSKNCDNKRKKILQKCREFLDCGVAWRQCKTQSSFSDKILMNLKNKLKFKETSMTTMKITCGMFLIQNSPWDRLKLWTTSI